MHRLDKTAIAALCVALAACFLATTVAADPATPPDPYAIDVTKPPADPPAVTTGSIQVQESTEKRMADCMAIWEPRTHMTKQEWRRTCKQSLEELPHI